MLICQWWVFHAVNMLMLQAIFALYTTYNKLQIVIHIRRNMHYFNDKTRQGSCCGKKQIKYIRHSNNHSLLRLAKTLWHSQLGNMGIKIIPELPSVQWAFISNFYNNSDSTWKQHLLLVSFMFIHHVCSSFIHVCSSESNPSLMCDGLWIHSLKIYWK